ncbi:fibronectin type III domain-containing protein, partial [Paenibacillus sp. Soil522]|uniref:fibronectin type III domain-containing protein n=1 Tax=Paenibacillus sp. Soil522 TaxID=1736388 RepID=UPI003FA6ECBA
MGYTSQSGSQYWFKVTGLKPGTTYYYQLEATSGKKIEKSGVLSFTTLSEPLIITGVQAYSTGTTFTKFEWSTNHNATSALYFGVDPLNLDQTTMMVEDGGTLHLAYADQLTPGTTYYYQVVAKDDYGNYVKSEVYKFTTL